MCQYFYFVSQHFTKKATIKTETCTINFSFGQIIQFYNKPYKTNYRYINTGYCYF